MSAWMNSFVACNLGAEYIGYSMMTFGISNFFFSVVVGLLARHVVPEAIVGVASVLQVGLVIFLLVWIPDRQLTPVFFVISALWGLCDAIWQIQCNCLVGLSCSQREHDVAFQNCRSLQGLGAAVAFGMTAVSTGHSCISVKLYVLVALLAVSLLFYAVFEYRLRKQEAERARLSARPSFVGRHHRPSSSSVSSPGWRPASSAFTHYDGAHVGQIQVSSFAAEIEKSRAGYRPFVERRTSL